MEESSHTECVNFALHNLTVGQIVSASSAAAGVGAVPAWVQSLIELVRQTAKDRLSAVGFLCGDMYKLLLESLVSSCNKEVVLKEVYKFMGCATDTVKTEASFITAKRWVRFLRKMAIEMTASSPGGNTHAGHMAIDAVREAQRC